MEKWYVQGKSEKASRKFSVKKYWRKPNAGDMHDAICDFILGCGIPDPGKVDSLEVYTDDLIFVEGGAGEWNAGGAFTQTRPLWRLGRGLDSAYWISLADTSLTEGVGRPRLPRS